MLFPYSQVCTFVYYSSLSGLMQEISYIFNLVKYPDNKIDIEIIV